MEFFDKARKSLTEKKPFAIFRKPDAKLVKGIFQENTDAYVLDDFAKRGFAMAPFGDGPIWLLPESESMVLEMPYDSANLADATPELEINPDEKNAFEALVKKGISAIGQGEFEKVVLSRTEHVTIDDLDVFVAFNKLASAYPSAFVYLWFHPETDIWLAATPEKLLHAKDSNFKTMALAGTQKFQGELVADWPKKEKEEQRFVTDFIWSSLENVVSEIELSAPYTHRAGNLLHIRTDIKGELNADADLGDVVSILHPTPAVCGLPRDVARRFILDNEGYDREFYSGYIGELNRDSGTDLYVNLRCMKVSGNIARLFAGCGITKDSVAEKEFFETVNKMLTIRKCLSA